MENKPTGGSKPNCGAETPETQKKIQTLHLFNYRNSGCERLFLL